MGSRIDPAFLSDLLEAFDLAAFVGESVSLRRHGHNFQGLCPFHDDREPSFSVKATGHPARRDGTTKGLFQCFGCQTSGDAVAYVMRQQGLSFAQAVEFIASRQGVEVRYSEDGGQRRPKPGPRGLRLSRDSEEPIPLSPAQLERLQDAQAQLSQAADYLASRRIPLELVRSLGGGFMRASNVPRLVLPHTDPQGRIVSLYGRRIDGINVAKHTHQGDRPKGWLNAPAALAYPDLWICEGAFDALALMAAGVPNTVAVFGVDGIRWGWLRQVRRIILGFDCDEAGQRALMEQAQQALMRGVEVLAVTPDELGGCKDIAEAWATGKLALSPLAGIEAPTGVRAKVLALADSPPPHLADLTGSRWADYRTTACRFAAELLDAAQACGWTERELFAVPSPGWHGSGGALWHLAGRHVTAADARCITGTLNGLSSAIYRDTGIQCAERGRMPWDDPT